MFRKGPRVSRRLCGFRRGRPFSGSVVNPSFFFFFSTHPTPPKTKATFFLLSAPLEPSIEVARSPVDPESTVKNIPSNEVYLQRSAAAAARGRTKGARTRRLQDHIDRAGARLVFFFFFLGGGDPAPRSVGAAGGLQVFYDRVEREGERRRQARRLAERRGRSRTIACVRLRTSAGCSWPPQADDQTRNTVEERSEGIVLNGTGGRKKRPGREQSVRRLE